MKKIRIITIIIILIIGIFFVYAYKNKEQPLKNFKGPQGTPFIKGPENPPPKK